MTEPESDQAEIQEPRLDPGREPIVISRVQETGVIILTIACHITVLATLIVGSGMLHRLLLAEGDPKLYDWVPWRFLVDTADIGLVVAYVFYGTISFAYIVRTAEATRKGRSNER